VLFALLLCAATHTGRAHSNFQLAQPSSRSVGVPSSPITTSVPAVSATGCHCCTSCQAASS